MKRRSIVTAVALLGVAVALVGVGRWERERENRRENAGLAAVFAAVGPLKDARPTGWRIGPPSCVAFSTPQNALGLQLCFDAQGRLVESVDRRGAQPVYSSLVDDPSAAKIRVSRSLVDSMLPTFAP